MTFFAISLSGCKRLVHRLPIVPGCACPGFTFLLALQTPTSRLDGGWGFRLVRAQGSEPSIVADLEPPCREEVLDYFAFSTCPNSSSTGVERPKISTATRTRLLS